MNKTDAREVLEAITTRDEDVPTAALDRLGNNETLLLVSAAVSVAAEMRFKPGGDVRAITDFARQMHERFEAAGLELKPLVVEAIVRAAMGEDDLLEGVSGEDILSTGMLVVYEIVSQQHLGPVDMNEFYREVLDLAEEFENAG